MFDVYKIKKILVIQFYQIGDVLLTTPLVKVLKKEFPNAKIHFCCNKLPSNILQNNPNVDKIIINTPKSNEILKSLKFYLSFRKEKYDIVIDTLGTNGSAALSFLTGAKYRIGWNLRIRKMAYNIVMPRIGNCYAAKAKLEILKKIINKDYDDAKPEIYLTDDDYIKVNIFWEENNFNDDDFIVVISPYSRRAARRWLPEYFAQLANMLIEKYQAKIIIQYGPGEEDYINKIKEQIKYQVYLDPKTNLRELSALLKKSKLFIGNDNGPKHLAVAVGTPTITIYGPTDPINWEYPNPNHIFLQDDNLNCIKCGSRICPKQQDENMLCMKNIKPEDVFNKVEILIKEIYDNR